MALTPKTSVLAFAGVLCLVSLALVVVVEYASDSLSEKGLDIAREGLLSTAMLLRELHQNHPLPQEHTFVYTQEEQHDNEEELLAKSLPGWRPISDRLETKQGTLSLKVLKKETFEWVGAVPQLFVDDARSRFGVHLILDEKSVLELTVSYLSLNEHHSIVTLEHRLLLFGAIALFGGILWLLYQVQQLSRQKELLDTDYRTKRNEADTIAMTDLLTKVASRRRFELALEENLTLASRYHYHFSLVLMDIDHFKRFNDTYGHDAGDLVLKEVAQFIHKQVRTSDLFARWGGEEFVLLLPMQDHPQAYGCADGLRQRVSELKLPSLPQVTLSMGVATWREGQTRESLLKKADEALYTAKREGRNTVRPTPSGITTGNEPFADEEHPQKGPDTPRQRG